MENEVLDKKSRTDYFVEKLKECQENSCLVSSAVKKGFKIGKYIVMRLTHLEDGYNTALIEDNYSFIFDEEGVPYQICETPSGNVREYSQVGEQIKSNEDLLKRLTNALIFIDLSKKLPYVVKYKQDGKNLEEDLKHCFDLGDFSNISVDKYIDDEKMNKMRKKYVANLDKDKKYRFQNAVRARFCITRGESLRQYEIENEM